MKQIISLEEIIKYTKLLGLPLYPTADELKEAFRTKMKEIHPDTKKSSSNTKKTQELSEAYHELLKILPIL